MNKIELTMRPGYLTTFWDIRVDGELVCTTNRMQAAFAKVEALAADRPNAPATCQPCASIASLGISLDTTAVKAATDQLNELYAAAERIGELGRRLRAGV